MSGRTVDTDNGASRGFCLTELSMGWLVAGAFGVSVVLWSAILAVI